MLLHLVTVRTGDHLFLLHLSAALSSYARSAAAWGAGVFSPEISPVTILGKRGKPDTVVAEDEEFKKINKEKFAKLATVFQVQYNFSRFRLVS